MTNAEIRPVGFGDHGNLYSEKQISALRAEKERLNSALKWEQNRLGRVGTHGPDCAHWGPSHYECLERENAELRENMRVLRCALDDLQSASLVASKIIPQDGFCFSFKDNIDMARKAILDTAKKGE